MQMFQKDVATMASKIQDAGYKFLYGVPRGGIYVAMELSKQTGIPIIDELPKLPDITILVVDDIVDSGRTRAKYAEYIFACLHIKPYSSKEEGLYWVHTTNDWITYWWEKCDNNSTIEDNVTRIIEFIGADPTRYNINSLRDILICKTKEFINACKN